MAARTSARDRGCCNGCTHCRTHSCSAVSVPQSIRGKPGCNMQVISSRFLVQAQPQALLAPALDSHWAHSSAPWLSSLTPVLLGTSLQAFSSRRAVHTACFRSSPEESFNDDDFPPAGPERRSPEEYVRYELHLRCPQAIDTDVVSVVGGAQELVRHYCCAPSISLTCLAALPMQLGRSQRTSSVPAGWLECWQGQDSSAWRGRCLQTRPADPGRPPPITCTP